MKRIFRYPALSPERTRLELAKIQQITPNVIDLKAEWCFYLDQDDINTSNLSNEAEEKEKNLHWLLAETYESGQCGGLSYLNGGNAKIIEIGPRLGLVTPWSTSAQAILEACSLDQVERLEATKRFCLIMKEGASLNDNQLQKIKDLLHDKMVEQIYDSPLTTFASGISPEPVLSVPIMEQGKSALKDFIEKYGLQLTSDMQAYIFDYFQKIKRNPTDVELFMFGQLNSEHCRHHIFNGAWTINDRVMGETLMDMVKETVKTSRGNLVVAFKDNAAVLDPVKMKALIPTGPGVASFRVIKVHRGFILKIETHNHPTTVSPYAGAATGVAVRRDDFGVGRGGVPVGHFAGYYVGNLFLPGYSFPWEREYIGYSPRFATPAKIFIEASNGASDNCNCFGNPVIIGTARSFEQMINNTHYGYRKTAMVAGSFGYIDKRHIEKREAKKGMLVVQTGGLSFPIGVGGGSGSSKDAGGQGLALDFNSVQRGDAFTERGNFNVIRACSELGKKNPIVTITDLGAGGDCVAVPELVLPAGAKIELRDIPCGDQTMPVWVYWCNESQERMAYLIWPNRLELFQRICERNRCQMAVIGEVTGDGKFVLTDNQAPPESPDEQKTPIDLDMNWLLADLPQKKIVCETEARFLWRPKVPKYSFAKHLNLVLSLPDVASKEWLTRKADRTVGNRSVRQQEVGPLQLPLADCAVLSDGPYGKTGNIIALGEQPIKGLVDNKAGVRMSVGEALTNAVWAPWKSLSDLNFSATWQWPCGQIGEDARLYEAVRTAKEIITRLGSRIGVGKDSLSMTLKETKENGDIHPILAPGTVQMVVFGPCDDINRIVTPDIKRPGESLLMFVDLAKGSQHLGGSALLRVHEQIGNESPDLDNPEFFVKALTAIQTLIRRDLILSGHDRSDGGLISCILEMAFAGNCGVKINLKNFHALPTTCEEFFFNEELGLVFEFLPVNCGEINKILHQAGIKLHCHIIGETSADKTIKIKYNRQVVLEEPMPKLMANWRETSFRLDELQSSPEIVEAWRANTYERSGPSYSLSFTPKPTPMRIMTKRRKPTAIVVWEAGTNGDRDAAETCHLAGFKVINIHKTDLTSGKATLKNGQLLFLPGGFAFRDTMDAGKGSAGVFKFNKYAADELAAFIDRPDTLIFGPCNGCQEMALLGILPWSDIPTEKLPRFITNRSERFEHQLITVKILPNNSVFLKDMEGSIFGIIVSHAQGRFHCPDEGILKEILTYQHLAPIRYVNDQGEITEDYPFNPNGSPLGIAGLSSKNGRFLAMMPHPERLPLLNLYPWVPQKWKNLEASPTLKMFQSAREWCSEHRI